jgi:hypothetical protein
MCQTASQQRGRGKPNEAFSDFEGCGALQCNTCKTFFCCFCFTIGSSGNVHKHVPACDKNPEKGEIYPLLYHKIIILLN